MAQSKEMLKVGDKIPSFELPDQNGKLISIDSLLVSKNLVIYFYPKDYTSGCTAEACSFRDHYEVFKEYDAEVIGISTDGANRHNAFAKSYQLGFILLSDKGKKVEKLFGVPRALFGLMTGRVTFVVDKKGLIRHVFRSQTQATKHVDEALQIVKSLK
ncbi:peroxiredoxin [uncultured Imperialibacter sp.]|uniref:peroxiredoxin n=1 Tax=uncultured Imperialibacter sp. TaxID=1672639 RepID=UPI0030DC73CC|tara:strand:+ start:45358 stop:45831 length:474 start_codon:yes stop_codon:yes gene_type:complete